MRLVLVRHAETAPGEPDDLRRLTPRGHEQAHDLGLRLARDFRPDVLLTSPLLRARETAAAIGRAIGVTPEPTERLSPGATAEDILLATAGRGETVVCVGHNPDCGQVAAQLAPERRYDFPPAGIAVITIPTAPHEPGLSGLRAAEPPATGRRPRSP
jgi:phosphohistidine phosphatase